VLGHVDSGKTSICRVLTQVASTASLDKSPQSKERGITLDLGFSSFFTRIPQPIEHQLPNKYLQFTLVDCPGHASLIRTIIGGAQIIDIMLLVIDVNKGIQTQTAECIIIAEMFINKLVVLLNKIDTIEEKEIPKKIEIFRKIFAKTKFADHTTIFPYSTK
jgi:selenocysteine-specific elongation factor